MPLTMTAAGETATIKKVGGNEEVRRHLENLGFVTGVKVMVVSVAAREPDRKCKGIKGSDQQRDG